MSTIIDSLDPHPLIPDGTPPVNLALDSAQTVGQAVRLIYTRPENQ